MMPERLTSTPAGSSGSSTTLGFAVAFALNWLEGA
ncbi:MAG: hypothetical protein KatS3mg009_2373 [Acidimicrobiia bacterium]|nr:MAG: hypothetical protein KatS3mg009_2373 [Acidimicrobiia bacterium]